MTPTGLSAMDYLVVGVLVGLLVGVYLYAWVEERRSRRRRGGMIDLRGIRPRDPRRPW